MNLQDAIRNLAGGDHPMDAVRERRCIKDPIGCGQGLEKVCREKVGDTGVCTGHKGHIGDHRLDDHYEGNMAAWECFRAQQDFVEWTHTGLCQACQDTLSGKSSRELDHEVSENLYHEQKAEIDEAFDMMEQDRYDQRHHDY